MQIGNRKTYPGKGPLTIHEQATVDHYVSAVRNKNNTGALQILRANPDLRAAFKDALKNDRDSTRIFKVRQL